MNILIVIHKNTKSKIGYSVIALTLFGLLLLSVIPTTMFNGPSSIMIIQTALGQPEDDDRLGGGLRHGRRPDVVHQDDALGLFGNRLFDVRRVHRLDLVEEIAGELGRGDPQRKVTVSVAPAIVISTASASKISCESG